MTIHPLRAATAAPTTRRDRPAVTPTLVGVPVPAGRPLGHRAIADVAGRRLRGGHAGDIASLYPLVVKGRHQHTSQQDHRDGGVVDRSLDRAPAVIVSADVPQTNMSPARTPQCNDLDSPPTTGTAPTT